MIFLVRITISITVLYLIYFVYKSLKKPAPKKLNKETITPCPSPKVFMDYTEGRVKDKKKRAIDNHIAQCKSCQDALNDVFDMPKKKTPK